MKQISKQEYRGSAGDSQANEQVNYLRQSNLAHGIQPLNHVISMSEVKARCLEQIKDH